MSERGDLRVDYRLALDGKDRAALSRLVVKLTPVVQARVARKLLLFGRRADNPRDVRQDVADLTQEVFLALFAEDARVLRSWQPERGLSLENFVGLVAERQAVSILRSHRRSPLRTDPTLDDEIDPSPAPEPEREVISRDTLNRLLDRLAEQLSPLGRHLFQLLVIDDLTVEEVVARTGMSVDAIWAWRSRLRKLARQILVELSEPTARKRIPSVGARR